MKRFERVMVWGDGSWATALAALLADAGVSTVMWSAFPERLASLAEHRENRDYLPEVPLPAALEFQPDPIAAAEGADLVLSVVPTQYLRQTASRFSEVLGGKVPVVSGTKGLEIESFLRPTEVLCQELGARPSCVLSGPSHAEEVARACPASLVAASEDERLAQRVQATFNTKTFRVYTSIDPIGVELAGALKNVIALAAGICDGLELGDNAKAALLTRGLVELARFGKARGARPETFFGLAGVGDLITTCTSQHSRNRSVGERLGRGQSLEHILEAMQMVAEGVWTTQALFGPEAELSGVQMPIAEQVHAVLFGGRDPRAAVEALMEREPAGELDSLIGDNWPAEA
ncbi:MAG: NAD(P)H-dependent glycerol-3-phosphate dehydrogenase [Planctomycetota bacterium]